MHIRTILTVFLIASFISTNARAERPIISKYNDQVITHNYECNGMKLEISGTFNVSKQGLLELSGFMENTKTGEAADISDYLKPHFTTLPSIQKIIMICNSGKSWIYLLITDSSVENFVEVGTNKTLTIHDNFEVEEGMLFKEYE